MATASKEQPPSERRYLASLSYQALRRACAAYMRRAELDVVQRAYLVAARAHEGTKRHSGEPYIEHPLAVALWLATRRVTAPCVAAALLHDVVEDTPIKLQGLTHMFGAVVAALVDGVTKFEAVEVPDSDDEVTGLRERKRQIQAETFRKLMLAMAEDPRVALIKLADRLHNLRTLGAMRPDRQAAKARETMEIYVPLAQRLGMAEVKYELEDLALSYIEPERHAWLRQRIAEEVAARDERTVTMTRAMRHLMAQRAIAAEITPRVKHLYSVYRRVIPTGLDVRDVQDLLVFDVLVTTRQECYAALQAIHSQWQQIDARLRDYIGSPKLNGYQALHTTVFCFEGLVDIHIRTHAMQQIADEGPVLLAATQPEFHGSRMTSLAWIEQVRSWQRDLPLTAQEFTLAVQDDFFRDQIFIMTPKGEVKDLASDATVLDLAYRIHTDLGERCAGATVTGQDNVARHEGRDYTLQSGEIVEIVTDERMRPHAGWLRVARTRHAREAIAHYLRERDLPLDEPAAASIPPLPAEIARRARLALCCEPGPRDALVGVVTNRRLMVHRKGCWRVVGEPVTDFTPVGSISGRQVIRVLWSQIKPYGYRVTLSIMGRDRYGLVRDIATVMTDLGINVARMDAQSVSTRVRANVLLTIEVRDEEQLQRALHRLEGVDGVVSIEPRSRSGPDDDRHGAIARQP